MLIFRHISMGFAIPQFISEHLNGCSEVDVIYTDLTSAFDTVDYERLLVKLVSFGMSVSLILLLKSYLFI